MLQRQLLTISDKNEITSERYIIYCFLRHNTVYCKSGNIREVLIFANFAGSTNSRIHEFRDNYFYNSATKKKYIYKHAKITRSTVVAASNHKRVPLCHLTG